MQFSTSPWRSVRRWSALLLAAVLAACSAAAVADAASRTQGPLPLPSSAAASVRGTLEMLVIDRADGTSQTVLRVRTRSGRAWPLVLRSEDSALPAPGSTVEVTGTAQPDGRLAVAPSGLRVRRAADRQALVTPAAASRRVAFVLIDFNGSERVSRDRLGRVFNEKTTRPDLTVQSFFKDTSYRQASFESDIGDAADSDDDVFGSYTVPGGSGTSCALWETWTRWAQGQARNDGLQPSAYEHVVFVWPYRPDCPFGGIAYVGGSVAAINLLYPEIVEHELGHNLGLLHANSLRCWDDVGLAVAIADLSRCDITEYGDVFDVMGRSNTYRPFGAYGRTRIGWLHAGTDVAEPSSDGQYRLASISGPVQVGGSPRALAIPSGKPEVPFYHLEFRTQQGFDENPPPEVCPGRTGGVPVDDDWENMACSPPITGAALHIRLAGDPLDPRYVWRTLLIDATPETSGTSLFFRGFEDAALPVGRSFEDEGSGLSIRLDAVVEDPFEGPVALVSVDRP